jgi:hypothetical protein
MFIIITSPSRTLLLDLEVSPLTVTSPSIISFCALDRVISGLYSLTKTSSLIPACSGDIVISVIVSILSPSLT